MTYFRTANYTGLVFMAMIGLARADLKLPAIFSDHLVLQADQEDPVWGWAPAGSSVQAEFLDATGKTLAQASTTTPVAGKWSLKLPPFASKTSGTLRFTSGTEVKTIQDVVVGESWLCGGQSNMTYDFSAKNIPPEMIETAKKEATDAAGAIRFFVTRGAPGGPNHPTETPQEDSFGSWFVVTPDKLATCSCVAWNFAVALREKLDCPMGMVVCAVGGTRAEQWMSQAAIDACPAASAYQKQAQEDAITEAPRMKEWGAADAAWRQANPTPALQAQNAKTRPANRPKPIPSFCDLYNSMLHGLEPYGVKGVIWFQADGNLSSTAIYGDLIKALITSWRADWQSELPFYYVEMNNMRAKVQDTPVRSNNLSLLRERQADALTLPRVDVVCSIDCGLASGEPHFPNKKPVGQRLALLALDHLYHRPCVCHSVTYASFAVEKNKLRLHFTDAAGLRIRDGSVLAGFAITDASGKWVWANGQIDGQDILLWNDQIAQPTAARYAWAENPLTSIENGAGLPLRPFRTDTTSPQ